MPTTTTRLCFWYTGFLVFLLFSSSFYGISLPLLLLSFRSSSQRYFFIIIFNYQQLFFLNFWVNCLFFLMIRVLLLYQLNWKTVWRLMLTEPVVHILEVGMIMDGFIFLSELDCFSGYDEFESFYWS